MSADILSLIGLDLLDKYEIFVNNVSNSLFCDLLNIKLPLTRKHVHIYLEWKIQNHSLYTYFELLKLLCNFSHLAADNLYNLLKLARLWKANQETKEILDLISRRFDSCQIISNAPVRFPVSLSAEHDLVFGEELSIDLIIGEMETTNRSNRYSATTF